MLKSKCIYKPKTEEDGTRISIMFKHLLNDLKTPDPQIISGVTFDEHLVDLAPDPKVVGAYLRGEIEFEEYAMKYREKLGTKVDIVAKLIRRAVRENITVMCKEDSPVFCHRKMLIEFAQKVAEIMGIYIITSIE